jgi:hypothetical protein
MSVNPTADLRDTAPGLGNTVLDLGISALMLGNIGLVRVRAADE